MADVLQEAAQSFERLSKTNYEFTLSKKQKIIMSSLSASKGEFTHTFGLDHLDDIWQFASHNIKVKSQIFRDILKGNYTYQNLQNETVHLNDAIPKTYNSITGKEYTIDERIKKVGQIDKILDIAFTGELYKWDLSKCNVRMPNGQHRKMKIRADYVLKIPSPDNNEENLYIFAYQQNQVNKKDKAIKLSVISAFADCVDLTQGQEKSFTILKEEKQNIISKKKQTLFVHPAYQNEKEELAKKQSEPKSSNDSISPTDEQKSLCLSAKTE